MALKLRRGIDSDFTLNDGTTIRQFEAGEPVFNTTNGTLHIGQDGADPVIVGGTAEGGGFFKGNNGDVGNADNGRGDIFRVNASVLTSSVNIISGNNASATGPVTVFDDGDPLTPEIVMTVELGATLVMI